MDISNKKALRVYRAPIAPITMFALLIFSLSGLLAPAWAEDGSHLLDGKSYVGKNGEVGQDLAEYEDEEITFVDGLFTSVSCAPYKFSSSPYQTRVENGKIYFEAVTDSPSHGKISWSGTIDGDETTVAFVWTKERWYWDIRREYWFHGKLKN